ncbi:hypothetical protein FNJ87_01535, partial [Nonlabens mediterrranea]|nr:hypothetical protein [Nonlabens mediterrranea]
QVFDKTGKAIALIGADQKINAATGIFVSENEIYLTDFENGRILIYDMNYKLKQIIDTEIDKPTDIFVQGKVMYITNYRKGQLIKYTLKDIAHE